MPIIKNYLRLDALVALLAFVLIAAVVFGGVSARASDFRCNVGVAGGASAHVIEVGVPGASIDGIGGDGYSLGVLAGCDLKVSGFLLGVVGDATWHNAETTITLGGGGATVGIDATYFIGGRLGFAFVDAFTAYLLAGYTWADTSASIGGAPRFEGVTLGGGMDVAIDKAWLVRAEYRHTLYDAQTIGGVSIEPRAHEARMALVYRFGADDVIKAAAGQ